MAFTAKQRLFIDHYLKCWNATQAAIRAGYSEKTARQMGAENLSKPAIREEIDKRLKASKLSADKALYLLTQQAEATLASFYDRNSGTFTLDSDEAQANFHLLKKVKLTRVKLPAGVEKQTIQLELEDKQTAITLIGKYYGLFTEKVEHSGTITHYTEDTVLAELRRRVEAGELSEEELLYVTGNNTSLADELFRGAANRVPISKSQSD